ncbi:carbamoyltransferase HypF [Mycolicibacterium sp.]|uniref:carbamoyltransferase HypF n=1 Tax=Mycolicibacterium sp. TaxID=2320850 RepID=UPI0025D4EF7A|nr:carbamoyltransferase HypF [Mycolicibacterium sp.]
MTVRVRLDITGVVQGVGFRPAVARIATGFGLSGWVYNDAGSVHCELEGTADDVDAAISALQGSPPPMARIDTLTVTPIPPCGKAGFEIVGSQANDGARTLVPPDIAVCGDCLREMRDPADRRYQHPFITCTNCGPRYTVITDLPYDRPATTMAGFGMCAACAVEYRDPADRRYHAQTIACRDCGPRLSWRGADGSVCAVDDPIGAAVEALLSGRIVAVKGIGGYHLACRADDTAAVATLRARKNRPAKPFAVMVADLAAAGAVAEIDAPAAAALTSPAAPIVLVRRRSGSLSDAVAPGLADLGVMLAYSPVHHLLFDRLGPVPLVMTSANRGGSPIVFRDEDLDWIVGSADGSRMPDLADAVLTHDRPIGVPCEDSVVTIDDRGGQLPLRRSRGYAPLPATVDVSGAEVVLAAGGDLKTTFCLMGGAGPDGRRDAHLSSHLGDMADPRTQVCFEAALEHLAFMTGQRPEVIACDLHPGYATSAWARRYAGGRPVLAIQHHHAHAVSLLADHRRLGTPMVALTYDGTGYGTDGTVWGGEVLTLGEDPAEFSRSGHLAPFALPGAEGALRQPARIALDLLVRAGVEWTPDLPPVAAVGADGLRVLAQQIPRGVGCAPTTSMGRLFDAIASLLGVCQQVSYEGQAAVELESLARRGRPAAVDFAVDGAVMDPAPLIAGLVAGLRAGADRADLAAGFHQAVIRASARAAAWCAGAAGVGVIGLTGGAFANRQLLQGLREHLTNSGYEVLTHRIVPCNDGGLALGQAAIAAALRARTMSSAGSSTAQPERNGLCASESPAR